MGAWERIRNAEPIIAGFEVHRCGFGENGEKTRIEIGTNPSSGGLLSLILELTECGGSATIIPGLFLGGG